MSEDSEFSDVRSPIGYFTLPFVYRLLSNVGFFLIGINSISQLSEQPNSIFCSPFLFFSSLRNYINLKDLILGTVIPLVLFRLQTMYIKVDEPVLSGAAEGQAEEEQGES